MGSLAEDLPLSPYGYSMNPTGQRGDGWGGSRWKAHTGHVVVFFPGRQAGTLRVNPAGLRPSYLPRLLLLGGNHIA